MNFGGTKYFQKRILSCRFRYPRSSSAGEFLTAPFLPPATGEG
jgi:hypothetical protein